MITMYAPPLSGPNLLQVLFFTYLFFSFVIGKHIFRMEENVVLEQRLNETLVNNHRLLSSVEMQIYPPRLYSSRFDAELVLVMSFHTV